MCDARQLSKEGPSARRPAAHSGFERLGEDPGRGIRKGSGRGEIRRTMLTILLPSSLSVISDKNILILWVWGYRQQVARPIPATKAAAGARKSARKGDPQVESAHSNWNMSLKRAHSTCTTHKETTTPRVIHWTFPRAVMPKESSRTSHSRIPWPSG